MEYLFEGYSHLGEEEVGKLLTEKIQLDTDWSLSMDDIAFYWGTLNDVLKESGAGPVIEEKAKQFMTAEFIEIGLEIGKDFSFIDGKIWLSEHAMAVIKEKMPQEIYDYLNFSGHNPGWTLEEIENNIGLPGYFERMINVVKERMDLYAEQGQFKLAADYLWYLMEGTCTKLPMLENTDFVSFLFAAVVQPIHRDAVMEWVSDRQKESLDEETLDVMMEDLITATGAVGCTQTYLNEEGKKMFSKNHFKALNQVWESIGGTPLREIIAMMENLDVKHKRGEL